LADHKTQPSAEGPRPIHNGWTGAQSSVVRACAGAALAARFVEHAVPSRGSELVLHVTGALWSLLFAAGLRERAASYALAPTLIAAGFAGGEGAPGQVHWLALGVLLHLSMPEAPYGSLDARGRVDPGGGWRMPDGTLLAARLALLGVLATFAFSRSDPYLACAWFAALSFDPRWIAPKTVGAPDHVFYDGTCALCHGFVRFVLAESHGERPDAPERFGSRRCRARRSSARSRAMRVRRSPTASSSARRTDARSSGRGRSST
jgi:hypothetical protein